LGRKLFTALLTLESPLNETPRKIRCSILKRDNTRKHAIPRGKKVLLTREDSLGRKRWNEGGWAEMSFSFQSSGPRGTILRTPGRSRTSREENFKFGKQELFQRRNSGGEVPSSETASRGHVGSQRFYRYPRRVKGRNFLEESIIHGTGPKESPSLSGRRRGYVKVF